MINISGFLCNNWLMEERIIALFLLHEWEKLNYNYSFMSIITIQIVIISFSLISSSNYAELKENDMRIL